MLKAVESIDGTTGEKSMQIMKLDSKGNPLSVILPDAGEVSSLLKHYNTILDSNDSSGGFSIFSQIDSFAGAIVQKVNAITIDGYGLDDTSALPPGRTFFEPSIGQVKASTIEISPDVLNKPRDIPISDSPNEPGNNNLALEIGRLAVDSDFLNGFSPSEFYTGFIGKLGSLAGEANYGLESSKLVADQLLKQRESVIGVNLDEEAVNLIKFQRAFEASSRVINTTNEMLITLVNLGT
jgi:flagellar hook-associated protein 1 FlgK